MSPHQPQILVPTLFTVITVLTLLIFALPKDETPLGKTIRPYLKVSACHFGISPSWMLRAIHTKSLP